MILSVCCYIVPTATEPLSRMGDSYSGSSDEVARNPIAPQGMGSVGEEGASNIVGGGSGPSGTGPLGSTATPAASTPAATNSGLSGSKRSRRRSWVWNHFSIVDNFKNEKGIDIGQRAVCHYCDTNYKCLSNNGVGPHGRHLEKHHPDKIANASCSNFVYSKEKMRHGLALYVAAAEQPFTFGDDIRFEHFVKNCLNPSFVKVSRNSTRSDTKKAHSEVKKDLISELATVGAIGFTSDMWSVASESAFSAGKRVLDERRSRLAPDILDCLICLKDWEDARLGIQKRSAKDEFRGYFADSDIDKSFGFSGTLRAATSGQAFLQCVFDHWDMMMSDPLESGSQAATLVSEIRKRKGLKEQMTPLSDFEDKL
ncbi:hypothetical protein RHSIM_Rhsim03G0173000 [Rhododendron simsii]|uniref:BED-type domain-containing protein n=1 Tax=Rhododendron simsii TaxID=118357 RepID=A0A834H962_RHOSS|nr:hypothetical protein RHSIM_Rhsim03G0173000 [Rhododendron simsii]